MTVGEKIRKARQLREMKQGELALAVPIALSRVHQYESNIRHPKESQLEEFASALGVPVEFLHDHTLDTCRDVEHALLELESTFRLEISEENGKIILDFKDEELHDFLHKWAKAKMGSNIDSESKKNYELWKADYPLSHAEESAKKVKEQQKKNKKNE